MIEAIEPIRRVLVLLLTGSGLLVAVLLAALAIRRSVRTVARRRRTAIMRRYQPLVDELLQPENASIALARLLSAPGRHRAVIG